MADPRFFKRAGPFTLGDLAALSGAALAGTADPERRISDVAPLETAGAEDVSFLDNRKYADRFTRSKAGACFVAPALAARAAPGMALLLDDDPYRAYALAAAAFYPELPPSPEAEIAASAVVAASARIGPGCEIGPRAVIGEEVEIGANCRIGPGAVLGTGVVLGEGCRIGALVSLSHCLLGKRVVIHPGACIGQDGFGFAMSKSGFVKVPQLGRVVIHDEADIGANTTIDRGSGPDTVIGPGCRIDNLVQIGHNVHLGRGCVIVAQAGISGSTRLEDFVVVAGQGGLTGHLTIGKGARIAAQAGVMRDVAAGETVGGSPAVPIREWHRQTAALARLARKKAGKESQGDE